MSHQITTAFVDQFNRTIYHVSQQKPSKFESKVVNKSQLGEFQFFDILGSVFARSMGARHSASPQYDTPHMRRAVSCTDWDWGELFDEIDATRVLIDPKSDYVTAAIRAMNRKKDEIIIEGMLADALEGRSGTTVVPFPTTQILDAGGSSVMTLAKLKEARKMFRQADIDDDAKLWFALAPEQLDQLLDDPQVTSHDYNMIKPLYDGNVGYYMGFNIFTSNLLPLVSGARQCLAWVQDGVYFTKGMDTRTDIAKRADLRFSWYAYVRGSWGALRMEDVKVIRVDCQE